MAFELNDVAPSSSSSSPSQSESDREDDASDHDVDQHLADELRAALHLAIGNICRAEDTAEQSAGSGAAFAMSDEAIAALTDLTYHYSTSLFANDLVAFSKHAKRQTVKTDDVLLMARKDRRRMLADLQRLLSDHPDRFAEAVRKPRVKERLSGAGTAAAAARKKAPAHTARRESGRRTATSHSQGAAQRGTPRRHAAFSSSSSSSSDDGSDDVVTLRRKKLDLERTNLDAGAFRDRGTTEHDDGDLSVIAHKDSFGESSDSDVERALGTQKTTAGRRKKPAGKKGRSDDDGTLGKTTKKKAAASPFPGDGDSDGKNNMVIDLADSD